MISTRVSGLLDRFSEGTPSFDFVARIKRVHRIFLAGLGLLAFTSSVFGAGFDVRLVLPVKDNLEINGKYGLVRSSAVADFNGDGRLDVAIAQFGSGHPSENPLNADMFVVRIFEQQADSSYNLVVEIPAFSGTEAVYYPIMTAGDLDADGVPEILLVDNTAKGIAILKRGANATYHKVGSVSTTVIIAKLVVGDFDFDGVPDILGDCGGFGTTFYKNRGNMAFDKARYFMSYNADNFTLADLDGDGRKDMLRSNIFGFGNLSFSLASQEYIFPAPLRVKGVTVSAATAADMDGDSIPEIVETHQERVYEPGIVSIYQHIGYYSWQADGTLLKTLDYRYAYVGPIEQPLGIAVEDIDRDGDKDILVFFIGGIIDILYKDGDAFLPYVRIKQLIDYRTGVALTNQDIHVVDFNGDGCPDIGNVIPQGYSIFYQSSCAGFPKGKARTQMRKVKLLGPSTSRIRSSRFFKKPAEISRTTKY